MPHHEHEGLTDGQVQDFINNGFVRLDNAFSADLAAQCRDELWLETGLSPDAPAGWTQPVIRVASKSSDPFVSAANTPRLHRAYNQLVGNGRWLPPLGLGTFPIRFPSPQSAGDDGWHIRRELRRFVGLHGMEGQHQKQRTGAPDALPPVRRRRRRCANPHKAGIALGDRSRTSAVRRAGRLPAAAGGRRLWRPPANAKSAWRPALRALRSCAIPSSSMRRRRTAERNRASWLSHPYFPGESSIRHRRPRPSKSPSAEPAD